MECGHSLSVSGLVLTQHDFLNEHGSHFVILVVEEGCAVVRLFYNNFSEQRLKYYGDRAASY